MGKGLNNFEDKQIIDEDKKLVDESKTDSQVTMGIISEIANQINPMIQLTVETPCKLGKLSKLKSVKILDKVQIGGGSSKNKNKSPKFQLGKVPN